MNYTKKILKYMEDQNVDWKVVQDDLNITIEFDRNKNPIRPLNATEFLELCNYLGIKPENL